MSAQQLQARPRAERSRRGACALSFDDGPDARWTRPILSTLREHGAVATFFPICERLPGQESLVAEILADGHEIALHCHRHLRHTECDEEQIERDTVAALGALERVGVRPRLWRTPWGVRTEATGRVARRHDLQLVRWTIDTHDWRGDPAAEMARRAEPALSDGAIVLMHDGLGPGARRLQCRQTAVLAGELARLAKARDLKLLPVGDLKLPPVAVTVSR